MQRRIQTLWLAGLTAATLSTLLAAAEPSLGKDLTATIVLQGQPCDKVVDSKRNSDSDYTASCHDGNRYHVFVDANGRVIVKKL
jgi:hypothetical protein